MCVSKIETESECLGHVGMEWLGRKRAGEGSGRGECKVCKVRKYTERKKKRKDVQV